MEMLARLSQRKYQVCCRGLLVEFKASRHCCLSPASLSRLKVHRATSRGPAETRTSIRRCVLVIAEIAQDKLVRLARCELVTFSIDGAHPQTIALQPSDEMPADESSPSAHERRLHRTALDVGISWG